MKNKVLDHALGIKFPSVARILLKTKLTFFILIFSISVALASESYEQTKLSLDLKNTEVGEESSQQKKSITGKVLDSSGNPLLGVSVVVKGTTTGVTTDNSGNFTITVPDNAILLFSFIGMKMEEIAVGAKTSVNVVLIDDVHSLQEVVAVGYGTQKRITLTGAVAAIRSEELISIKSDNIQNMLSGKIAGVKVTQKTSEPGRFDNDFQIRGMGAPLVMVDGVARDNFTKLDANEVESISILKDGSAAIYGVRAANGVVLITTKRGVKGTGFKLEYTGYVGLQNMINQPEPLDAIGFMQLQNEKAFNGGATTPVYPKSSFEPYLNGTKKSTDWEGNTMNKQAFQTQHSFSATGGTDKLTYFVNFGYNQQDGYWKSGDLNYNRYNLRSNVSAEIAKGLRFEALFNAMSDTKNQPSSWATWNLFKGYWTQIPLNPYYANDNPNYPFFAADGLHPDYMTDSEKSGYQKYNQRLVQTNMSLEWTIPWVSGLKAKGMFSYDYRENENKLFRKTFNLYTYNETNQTYTPAAVAAPSRLNRQYFGYITNQFQLSLAYTKTLNKDHNISGLLLYEESNRFADNFYAQRDYSMDAVDQLFAGNSTNQVGNMNTSDLYNYANKALVGRFNYDYLSKYLAEFSFRYDGSSMFQQGNQWGFFPSASIGWRMSEESFVKESDALNFISSFKWRASYGKMGDDRASSYQFLSGYNYPSNGYVSGGSYINAFGMRGMPNPNITWFEAATWNIGADIDLWNGKLGISTDIFQRNRTNLLATRSESLPGLVGANLPQENLESDRTQGFELTLSHRHKIGEFQYSLSGNMAVSRTKWVYREIAKQGNSYLNWRNNTNDRWNDLWWGIDNTGRFQTKEEIFAGPIYDTSKGNSMMLPGDLIFSDWNGDGIIDGNDIHPIGHNTAINKSNRNGGMPMLNYGFTLGAEYKGFDLNIVFQGSEMSWLQYPEQLEMPLPWNRNGLTMFLDRWHRVDEFDPNSAWVPGHFPSTYRDNGRSGFILPGTTSTFQMQDASYLRLKSLELGYNIPMNLSKIVGVSKARVFFNAYNLFTFTKLTYCDPEHTGDEYAYTYPLSQTFNFGLNLTF